MRFFESKATIEAGPDAVWAVLKDAANWSSWNSGVEGVEGDVAEGKSIKIMSHAAPGRTFPVKVTTVDPPRRLVFRGGMPLGLFRGERTYTLTPAGTGSTLFHMREEYTGPLLGMIWRSMPDLGPSFKQFANGLKQRVESGA